MFPMLIILELGGLEGWEGEQILCYRIPPRRLGIFKKRSFRMDAGSGQMVYVYFKNSTYPRDFPVTNNVKIKKTVPGKSLG